MSIRTQYNEFRQNLNNEIKAMVKAVYVETYGEEPNFEDGETYCLDLSDIPVKTNRMRICTISVDIYQAIDETNSSEKQSVEYINIDENGNMSFETHFNVIPFDEVKTDNLMSIYEFLEFVSEKVGINTEPRTAYVEWDISDSEYETFVGENIPTEVEIPFYVTDEEVEDYLSDTYGYCVESYTIDDKE